ncbi:16S rRNA (cytosine(1402)-N(4))-methyltransferase RsmH [Atopobacter phocae]|uniref:16S rRNA (cytosine(1402)-N(4))-methyltransferase RsmH n=1 Tax=Atopobacter phocae TaxID=136492 RepID=UPI0004707CB3|nr:16S rRNA (cytosine(1402)-N(4))-methyltransferase RsmH [Atopobacter phocae]
MTFEHTTVLLNEMIEQLNIKSDGIYVDATFGGGGHTRRLLDEVGLNGTVIAFDQDELAISHGKQRFDEEITQGRLILKHSNFRQMKDTLNELNISEIDGCCFDLGISSPQVDLPERGFSYRYDAPLDMRMDQRQALTAATIINDWDYAELVRIFYRYGEEKFSKQIARRIEQVRVTQPIRTTLELVDIIRDVIPQPARRKGGHPAKRIFQALRIAVNDELGAAEDGITDAVELLAIGGRVGVISFHSLEDGLVKHLFRDYTIAPETPRNLPILPNEMKLDYQLVHRKPIRPSDEEITANKRAQSAQLRTIERIGKAN